jgi:hypothetical protein
VESEIVQSDIKDKIYLNYGYFSLLFNLTMAKSHLMNMTAAG